MLMINQQQQQLLLELTYLRLRQLLDLLPWYKHTDTKRWSGKAGVYCWVNQLTKQYYVGSSKDVGVRVSKFRQKAYMKANKTSLITASMLRDGIENFRATLLEECPVTDLIDRENHWMGVIRPELNVAKVAGSNLGVKASEETRKKLSLLKMGNTNAPEIGVSLYDLKGPENTVSSRPQPLPDSSIGAPLRSEHLLSRSELNGGLEVESEPYPSIGAPLTYPSIGAPLLGDSKQGSPLKKGLRLLSRLPFGSITNAAGYLKVTRSLVSQYNGFVYKSRYLVQIHRPSTKKEPVRVPYPQRGLVVLFSIELQVSLAFKTLRAAATYLGCSTERLKKHNGMTLTTHTGVRPGLYKVTIEQPLSTYQRSSPLDANTTHPQEASTSLIP